jgi:hypothetical protein
MPNTRKSLGKIGLSCLGLVAYGLLGAVSLTAFVAPASAGITDFSLYRSAEYQQTGSNTVIPYNSGTNYFFTSLADVASNTDYDVNGLNVTVPTSGPINYTMTGPSGTSPFIEYVYESPYLTQANLNAWFPTGDYVLNASNTGTGATATVTLNYNGADFFSAPPQLTAASYDGLNGLNTNEAYTFSYDPFTPTGGNYASIFFNIYNATTGAVAYSQTFIGDDISSITVPADTLQPGTAYYDELDFSTRIQTTDSDSIDCTSSPSGQCPGLTELAWDSRTVTDFTTGTGAVPEPATWAMMLLGFAGLGFAGYRASSRRAAAAS